MKPRLASRGALSALRHLGCVAAILLCGSAVAAEPYPFEGTWVRADRVCTPAAPSLRTYTAKDLNSAAGRCVLRKVVFGSGEWELFEECRRPDRSSGAIEKIRMVGADQMIVKHQVNRLKIPRGRRFSRCTVTPPKPGGPPPHGTPVPETTASPPKP